MPAPRASARLPDTRTTGVSCIAALAAGILQVHALALSDPSSSAIPTSPGGHRLQAADGSWLCNRRFGRLGPPVKSPVGESNGRKLAIPGLWSAARLRTTPSRPCRCWRWPSNIIHVNGTGGLDPFRPRRVPTCGKVRHPPCRISRRCRTRSGSTSDRLGPGRSSGR